MTDAPKIEQLGYAIIGKGSMIDSEGDWLIAVDEAAAGGTVTWARDNFADPDIQYIPVTIIDTASLEAEREQCSLQSRELIVARPDLLKLRRQAAALIDENAKLRARLNAALSNGGEG